MTRLVNRYLLGIAAIVVAAAGCVRTVRPCEAGPQSAAATEASESAGGETSFDKADAATADEAFLFPLCGVLTDKGYAEMTLLVPDSQDTTAVFRFGVVDFERMMPPLAVDAGWWICVVDGEILSRPDSANPDAYGTIRIDGYRSDESNGEKGQE